MDGLIQQITKLICEPPGSLAYGLVLLVCVIISIEGALVRRHGISPSQKKRFYISAIFLLIIQLSYFYLTAITWQSNVLIHLMNPPLDRCIVALSLLLVTWYWIAPNPNRLIDILTALFLVLILAFGVTNYLLWSSLSAELTFNSTIFDMTWNILMVSEMLAALVFLFIMRPSFWGIGVVFSIINLVGVGHHFVLGAPEGDFASSIRLAMIISFPLIPLLALRVEKKPLLSGEAEDEDWIPEPSFEPMGENIPASETYAPESSYEMASLNNQLEVTRKALMEANTTIDQLNNENTLLKHKIETMPSASVEHTQPINIDNTAGGQTFKDISVISKEPLSDTFLKTLVNPVHNMMINASLIKSESVGVLNGLQRNFLMEIIELSNHVSSTINDLIKDPQKIKPLDQSITNTDPLICMDTTLANLSQSLREKNIALRLDIPDNLPQLSISRNILEQVLTHLLENAILASHADQTVHIQMDEINDEEANVGLLIQMTDSGGPIAPKNMDKIFISKPVGAEPKYRGVGSANSLRLVKTMVEAYNGKIWFESKNKQTTYYVQIPN